MQKDTKGPIRMQPDEIKQGRRPQNPAEADFYDIAAAHGFLLTKRGWPDFFLTLNGKVACVEVKPADSRALKAEQQRVMQALAGAGIPCFVWSPDGGLREVTVGVGGIEVRDSVGTLDEQLQSLVRYLQGWGSGGSGSDAEGPAQQQVGQQGSLPTPEPTVSIPSPSALPAIEEVWAFYVETMNPRHKTLGPGERQIIRSAVHEATADELKVCIRVCAESDYHMKRGQHTRRKGGKYNSLGKIMKPRPRLGETQRSRIDWWLDRDESSGVAGFPSADAAIVGQRQVEVQRGHQSGDPEMVRKATNAEAWLTKHGIETVRDSRGYPTFQRVGKGDKD